MEKALGIIMLSALLMMHREVTEACMEVKNDTVITYATERRAYFKDGELILKLVIDTTMHYEICQKQYKSDVLGSMFRILNEETFRDNLSDLQTERTKRSPLAFAALGIGAVAWLGFDYVTSQGRIEQLRHEVNTKGAYLKKVIMKDRNEVEQTFIAIRRNLHHITEGNKQLACNVERNVTFMMYQHFLLQEFDDILQSLHSERLTSKIIPPSQITQLIRETNILHDTIYVRKPYLLYQTAKFSANVEEATAEILRGALTIPLLKRKQKVLLSIATKQVGNELKVFQPVYVAESSKMSVEKCHKEGHTYICTDADLARIKMIELTNPILYDDGLIILNKNQVATVQQKKTRALIEVSGIAVCTYEDTPSLTHNNKLYYTQSPAFHVLQDTIDFDVSPFNITLVLATDHVEELNEKIVSFDNASKILHGSHLLLTGLIILVIIAAFIAKKIKQREEKRKRAAKEHIELEDVIIIEEVATTSEKKNGRKFRKI